MLEAAAEREAVERLPQAIGLVGLDTAGGFIVGASAAQVEFQAFRDGLVGQQRHEELQRDFLHVRRALRGKRLQRSDDVLVLARRIRIELEIVVAAIQRQREAQIARGHGEQSTGQARFEDGLRELRVIVRLDLEIGATRGGDAGRIGEAERIEAAGADRRAAIGCVQQVAHARIQDRLVLRLDDVSGVVRTVDVPAPVLERQLAADSEDVLPRGEVGREIRGCPVP